MPGYSSKWDKISTNKSKSLNICCRLIRTSKKLIENIHYK